MKLRTVGVFSLSLFSLLLVAVVAFINACSSSPTSPAATATPVPPTATSTPCLAGGNTCTMTFTSSATNSPTDSPTPTASNTATVTPTKTPTNTVTNTATNTATNTPCGFPGNTCTSTFTPIAPTNTPTPIPPTNTPTPIPPTSTPTISCTGTYSISGNVSYSGVSIGGNTLVVYLNTTLSGGGNSCSGSSTAFPGVMSSAYNATYLKAGNYYVVGIYGTFSSNGPYPGSYIGLYNGASDTCNGSIALKPDATTNPTGVNVTFDGTYQLWGANAQVTYTGSQTSKSLNAGLYSDSGYTTQVGEQGGASSGSVLTLIDTTSVCAGGGTGYLMVWYGNGNSNSPQTGDAYLKYGSLTEINTASTNATISFGDSNIW